MQFRFAQHVLAATLFVCLLTTQKSPVNGPSDLRVELRSTSGSNRFKVGEPIELAEATFLVKQGASRQPYLEPCGLFGKPTGFGFPLCRFFTRWSFTIKPDNGWTDIRGVEISGGPNFEVPNHDLPSNRRPTPICRPAHTVSMSLANTTSHSQLPSGCDDESTQRPRSTNLGAYPHFVTLTREFLLQIVAKS